jgi:hypothetical protein
VKQPAIEAAEPVPTPDGRPSLGGVFVESWILVEDTRVCAAKIHDSTRSRRGLDAAAARSPWGAR